MISKIYNKLEDDSDYVILDTRSVKWGDFKFTNGYTKHYITQEELLKPYLISFIHYNTGEYEDEILLVNNIRDPYEVVTGSELKIPNLQDLKQFLLDNTK